MEILGHSHVQREDDVKTQGELKDWSDVYTKP